MCRRAAGTSPPDASTARVAVISGSFGAGHDAAAREIRLRLLEHGVSSDRLDIIDLYPRGLGRLLKGAYFLQLRTVPTSWRWLLGQLESGNSILGHLVERIAHFAERRTAAALTGSYAAIVSTHPLASQTLGQLRRAGQVRVPVFTYLTDMSVHALWVHGGVDVHLAIHDLAAVEARSHGAAGVQVIQPAVRDGFGVAPGPDSESLRRAEQTRQRGRFGLPLEGALVLVTGGSEGVGELVAAAHDLRDLGLGHPVVLCGHNEHLRHRLVDEPGLTALGWVDDMPALFAAVDAVVQNAGGSTSLEALAAGCPVVSYRCLPGHGETNAVALSHAGLAPWARSPADLVVAFAGLLGSCQDVVSARAIALEGLRLQPCVASAILRITGELPA